jgi:hypothetical protein
MESRILKDMGGTTGVDISSELPPRLLNNAKQMLDETGFAVVNLI